jgi:glycosyltransferase involved in cell wall biosynthesis
MLQGISFVIPAYNEALNLPAIEKSVREIADGITEKYELVVVDDGSSDDTGEVVRRLSESNPNVVLVTHETNLGFGKTVRDGFDAARYDYIFYTDGDCQFDIADIGTLLPYAQEYDFVIGYRVHRADPFRRRFTAWVYNQMLRFMLGIRIRDVDCAFKLMKTSIIRSTNLTAETGFYFGELLQKALKAGAKIKEVPVNHYPRRFGKQTGGDVMNILHVMRDMAKYMFLPQRWKVQE